MDKHNSGLNVWDGQIVHRIVKVINVFFLDSEPANQDSAELYDRLVMKPSLYKTAIANIDCSHVLGGAEKVKAVFAVLLQFVLEFRRKGFPVPGVEKDLGLVEEDEAVLGFEDLRNVLKVVDASALGTAEFFSEITWSPILFEVKHGIRVDVDAAQIIFEGVPDHVEGLARSGFARKSVDYLFVAKRKAEDGHEKLEEKPGKDDEHDQRYGL